MYATNYCPSGYSLITNEADCALAVPTLSGNPTPYVGLIKDNESPSGCYVGIVNVQGWFNLPPNGIGVPHVWTKPICKLSTITYPDVDDAAVKTNEEDDQSDTGLANEYFGETQLRGRRLK